MGGENGVGETPQPASVSGPSARLKFKTAPVRVTQDRASPVLGSQWLKNGVEAFRLHLMNHLQELAEAPLGEAPLGGEPAEVFNGQIADR